MREASKSGGALGSISERELTLLQNSLVALDPNMSQDEFLRSLDKIEFHYERAQQAIQGIDPDARQDPIAKIGLQQPNEEQPPAQSTDQHIFKIPKQRNSYVNRR